MVLHGLNALSVDLEDLTALAQLSRLFKSGEAQNLFAPPSVVSPRLTTVIPTGRLIPRLILVLASAKSVRLALRIPRWPSTFRPLTVA